MSARAGAPRWAPLVLLVAACTPPVDVDAGSARDAGDARDVRDGGADDAGGVAGDAGGVDEAGVHADAGPGRDDGGLRVDAGVVADAGGEDDAGVVADAGSAADAGPWRTAVAFTRGPRQETGVVALAGEVVVVGGYTRTPPSLAHQMVRWVDAFDPQDNTWRALPDLPTELHHANVAVAGGTLYVLGFLGPSFAADGRGWKLVDTSWVPVASMPAGRERGAAGVCVHDDEVWVVGGYRLGAVAQVSRYDPGLDVWTPVADLPGPLDHLAAACVSGRVFVIGGRVTALGSHTAATWEWDGGLAQWAARTPMPTSRAGAAAAVVGGEVLVFGGEGATFGNGVFPTAEAYDVAGDSWRALAPMPTPMHGMGAASVGGRVYVPGGAPEEGFAASALHQVFVP